MLFVRRCLLSFLLKISTLGLHNADVVIIHGYSIGITFSLIKKSIFVVTRHSLV